MMTKTTSGSSPTARIRADFAGSLSGASPIFPIVRSLEMTDNVCRAAGVFLWGLPLPRIFSVSVSGHR